MKNGQIHTWNPTKNNIVSSNKRQFHNLKLLPFRNEHRKIPFTGPTFTDGVEMMGEFSYMHDVLREGRHTDTKDVYRKTSKRK